ncbi:AraC family transcriptional regulator [Streptococcus oricebi]|uniref:AraC family transcriptional regulator n=1 Tax=Streptococcus oricebi TaxID=1547447 RepID=A0ABS5B0Q6_9STRE|nr:AraC family transcriptional regulator [Streptococcus oricebi]MBP2622412.1 AraC family transcriptional regulator [Streptococcus oricebi]
MFINTEYQTNTIDLSLDFYGYEDCPAGYSFGPALRDNFVLHYISQGRGTFHYQDQVIELAAGDFFLLKPDELTFYQADSKEPWSYYWLGLSGTKISHYFQLSEIYQDAFIKDKTSLGSLQVGQLLEKIVKEAEQAHSPRLYQLHLIGQIYELLFQLGQLAPQESGDKGRASYQLYLEAKRMIESRYSLEQLSIQAIASELNIHRSYLSTLFKQYSKLSPKELLLYVRMQRAKQLLEDTQEPIKVIASSVGFSDALYFSKAFKHYFKRSPSQVRKKN